MTSDKNILIYFSIIERIIKIKSTSEKIQSIAINISKIPTFHRKIRNSCQAVIDKNLESNV